MKQGGLKILVLLFSVMIAMSVSATTLGLKFLDDSQIRLHENRLEDSNGQVILDAKTLIEELDYHVSPDSITFRRVFKRSNEQLVAERRIIQSQSRINYNPDLTQCFYLTLPGKPSRDLLDQLHQTKRLEFVYELSPRLVPARHLSNTPDLTHNQEHLFNPDGPHLERAWAYDFGTGAGVTIVDIEGGCFRFHEDLEHKLGNDSAIIGGICSNDANSRYHGASVAGMLVAGNNGFGVTGICYDATMKFYFTNNLNVLPTAINESQAAIEPGDIILIEMQVAGPRSSSSDKHYGLLPAEWDNMTRIAVANAIALNRVVIECAGNGSQNLDDPLYSQVFGPGATDIGSIIVGAGKPGIRSAVNYSNFGSRINVQGWAERINPCCQIWSAGYPDGHGTTDLPLLSYTRQFSGTSSAAAMVAGIAVCLQSAGTYRKNSYIAPRELRQILVSTGTPHTGDKHIGPLPDIGAAIDSIPYTDITVDLTLNQPMFTAGDPFVLQHVTSNPRSVLQVIRYVALQCLDEWFFLKCDGSNCFWVDYWDGTPMLLQPGQTEETLVSFTWPEGDLGTVTPGSGYTFYMAYFTLWGAEFIGNYDWVTFGWQSQWND